METAAKKRPEIIPVGTKRDDVKVLLVVNSKTETVVCVMIAAESEFNIEAKNRAEEIRCQEVLCLRKVGYGEAGEPVRLVKRINGRAFIVTRYVFQWSDWKWGIMKMVKPC